MSDDSEEYEDSEFGDPQPIIIDNGSNFMKFGFSGDDAPRSVFPTVMGRPRTDGVMVGMARKDGYVGDEALSKRGILSMTNPIDYGYITDWDTMERIWDHGLYYELRIQPEEHNVLLTDKHVKQKKINREKCIQIMFETFNIPNFYILLQSKLCLYAEGIDTGIVIDFGYNLTKCVPIYEGDILQNAIQQTDIGGDDVSKYLREILKNNDSVMKYFKEYIDLKRFDDILYDIKTSKGLCYMKVFPYLKQYEIENYTLYGYLRNYTKFDFDKNVISKDITNLCYQFYKEKQETFCYKLPDGVGLYFFDIHEKPKLYFNQYDRTQCLECMFKSSLLSDTIKSSEIGIHELCYNSIAKCDAEQQEKLCENIILCGGNSMFEGMDERFIRELKKLWLLNNVCVDKINIIFKPERKYLAWIGGSILTSLDTFNEIWITKSEYDEKGSNIVHQKCTF